MSQGTARGGCVHCGLPARQGTRYCCYGCELAAQILCEAEADHAPLKNTLTFSLLLTMSVMMLSLFLYAGDLYEGAEEGGLLWLRAFYRFFSWFLATPVMVLAGLPLTKRAFTDLGRGHLSMSLLIAFGAWAAYGLSVYALVDGRAAIYFDSATAAVVLATLGRYLEATARSKASGLLGSSVDSNPKSVLAHDEQGRDLGMLSPVELEPGMRIRVPAEAVVPVDMCLQSTGAFNLAVLSGESQPVTLGPGDAVSAGAVPVSVAAEGVVLRRAKDSALERLGELARGLLEQPSKLFRTADRFASWLTPVVGCVAGASLLYGWATFGLEDGVVRALSVALVACPCAYAIAAPLVHWIAMRRALFAGVVVRRSHVFEKLAALDTVAFDKTGTLTYPHLEVYHLELVGPSSRQQVLSWVHALEQESCHPVGQALLRYATHVRPALLEGECSVVPGWGVTGKDMEGHTLSLGKDASIGGSGVVFCRDGACLARFSLREQIRKEAYKAISALKQQGIDVLILSGDAERPARLVSEALGVRLQANSGAEDKLRHLFSLGSRAAMVGDGLNDVPSLAGGITGFAMGEGAGLARGVADIVLQKNDLGLVPWTIRFARIVQSRLRYLLAASTLYNIVFLAMAAGGYLKPAWAGLSMMFSSLLTLLASESLVMAKGPTEPPARGARPPSGARLISQLEHIP